MDVVETIPDIHLFIEQLGYALQSNLCFRLYYYSRLKRRFIIFHPTIFNFNIIWFKQAESTKTRYVLLWVFNERVTTRCFASADSLCIQFTKFATCATGNLFSYKLVKNLLTTRIKLLLMLYFVRPDLSN